jgi:hypothetical protein
MRLLSPIIANIFLVTSALGFGTLLRRLFPKGFSLLDCLAMTLLGGLGTLGTILFCAGQFRFSRTVIISILCLGVLLGFSFIARIMQEFRTAHLKSSPPWLPLVTILSVLIATAVGGLAAPIGDMNYDPIAYHYLGPKVWLREGVIRPVPDQVLTYFPVAVETQYAALMSLGGQRAPGLFAIVSLISILLIAASVAIRIGIDAPGAWWAAALIAAMPAVYRGAYGGFLDVLFAGFVLAAARICFDAEQPRHYALFGIFCGISMGTKYTGVVAWVLLVFCAFVISMWARPRTYGTILRHLIISCAVAIGVASPVYLRNWILYGCPVYPPPPVLLRYFNAKNMSPEVMRELVSSMLADGGGMGRGIKDFFLLPYNLTYHAANFSGAGGIGLAPLALAPFGLVVSRRNPFALGLVLFSTLQMCAWFTTAQVSRYAIHIYVIAAIFGVLGWQYVIGAASSYGRNLCALVIAISILYGAGMIIADRTDDIHATLSSSFEAQRRQKEIPYVQSFDYINGNPSVRKVLILNESVAAYFIDKPYIKPFGSWGARTLPGVTDVPEVMSQLANLHASHVLDVRLKNGLFKLPDKPPGLTLVSEWQDQRIYRID